MVERSSIQSRRWFGSSRHDCIDDGLDDRLYTSFPRTITTTGSILNRRTKRPLRPRGVSPLSPTHLSSYPRRRSQSSLSIPSLQSAHSSHRQYAKSDHPSYSAERPFSVVFASLMSMNRSDLANRSRCRTLQEGLWLIRG